MSRFPRGKEPTCPVCGQEKIHDRASAQCAKCARTPGWFKPHPDVPEMGTHEPTLGSLLSDDLTKRLRAAPATLADLATACHVTPGQALDALLAMQGRGVNVQQFGEQWSLERVLEPGGLDIDAYTSRPDGSYLFGWLSDTHLGSKYARLDALADTYRRFASRGVDRVFHAGNWIDGEANFNKYDLLVHGTDAQLQYFYERYPHAEGIDTYAVAGHDHEGWLGQREGIDIGRYAERFLRDRGRTDWHHLGHLEAFVPLVHAESEKRTMLHVMHPGGGSAYATSYTVQKIVEGYEGGSKPAVLLAGHYHKLEVINTRNVWVIQTGCLEDVTPFARGKKLRFEIGAGTCRLEQDPESGAILGCTVEMWHYFDRGFYTNARWSAAGPVTQAPRVTP